jgi:hypothetical protein
MTPLMATTRGGAATWREAVDVALIVSFEQAIQFGVRNIIQRGGVAQLLGQFRQSDAGDDRVQHTIPLAIHDSLY